MWHSHRVRAWNIADVPNAATAHGSSIPEVQINGPLSMMVCRRRPVPKLTRSLEIEATNDDNVPGTLLLGEHGCIPGSSHHHNIPPDSHLPPPHPGWRKTQLAGDPSPQNRYCATYVPALEDSSDGWCTDDNVYTPPVPELKPKGHTDPSGSSQGWSCESSDLAWPCSPNSRDTSKSDIPAIEDFSDGWVSDDSSNSSLSEGEQFNRCVRDYYNHGLLVPEQRFDFIKHLTSIVQLLKLSNTTAVYEALVDTHLRDQQLQIALTRILIYNINNDYFITTGSSMLALWELQATILSNPHINQSIWCVTQGGDPRFPLDPIDSPLNPVAVPSAPSPGPPVVPFHLRPSRLLSPHVSGIASNDVMSLDWTQTLGTTPDQPAGIQKPKTKTQLRHDHRRCTLDTKPTTEQA